MRSPECGVYFAFAAHLNSDRPRHRCPVATCGLRPHTGECTPGDEPVIHKRSVCHGRGSSSVPEEWAAVGGCGRAGKGAS